MGDSKDPNKKDGRLERSKKSRDLIIQAMRDLIDEGILSPTAQQVAETAQVGIRTVFRHANDMETLFKQIGKTNAKQRSALFLEADKTGTLELRIKNFLKTRTTGYAEMQNFILANAAAKWKYKFLDQEYKAVIKTLKQNLHEWFPEMVNLPKEKQEMIHAITSFEFWYRLRAHQNMSNKSANDLMANQLRSLLK
jgi:AcrR family transcriptional regulator|tara:strand:+ start:2455 stop:3039 length:585 start_codon:yes stop_codon:yes gene_type:complete